MKPANFDEAVLYFSDLDVATAYVAELRWPDGWECPHCGGRDYSYLSTRRLWKCKTCKKQSSVKVGTIFEGSPLGLDKWLPAIWLVANAGTEPSPGELAQALGVTEKSAWLMLQRLTAVAPTALEARGDATSAPHHGGAIALLVVVFALGVAVGRLTKRLTR